MATGVSLVGMSKATDTERTGSFRPTGAPDLALDQSARSMMEPVDQLRELLSREIDGRPFTELSGVTFDHQGAELAGHVLLDTLEDAGYSVDDYDAVGALTAAAVPLADAMLHAAASRGQALNAFVMDFVYPSIKGPSIEGKRVILLDAWLSQKSYVQTSSLVTLRKGNELSLDCSIIRRQGAEPLAIASLVGGLGPEAAGGAETGTADSTGGLGESDGGLPTIQVVDTVDDSKTSLPFICAFNEQQFNPGKDQER